MSHQIILASSSATRKQLMDRFALKYQTISPDIDETPYANESASELALRLSIEKAAVVAAQYPDAIVIASDQVAYLEKSPQQFIGKPFHEEIAIQQLQQQSGESVHFVTGLTVQCFSQNIIKTSLSPFQVKFRHLSKQEILRYVQYEQPLHCAGSFKCESLGITLFESMHGDDYTALMGLPLIQLSRFLREFGIDVP